MRRQTYPNTSKQQIGKQGVPGEPSGRALPPGSSCRESGSETCLGDDYDQWLEEVLPTISIEDIEEWLAEDRVRYPDEESDDNGDKVEQMMEPA